MEAVSSQPEQEVERSEGDQFQGFVVRQAECTAELKARGRRARTRWLWQPRNGTRLLSPADTPLVPCHGPRVVPVPRCDPQAAAELRAEAFYDDLQVRAPRSRVSSLPHDAGNLFRSAKGTRGGSLAPRRRASPVPRPRTTRLTRARPSLRRSDTSSPSPRDSSPRSARSSPRGSSALSRSGRRAQSRGRSSASASWRSTTTARWPAVLCAARPVGPPPSPPRPGPRLSDPRAHGVSGRGGAPAAPPRGPHRCAWVREGQLRGAETVLAPRATSVRAQDVSLKSGPCYSQINGVCVDAVRGRRLSLAGLHPLGGPLSQCARS